MIPDEAIEILINICQNYGATRDVIINKKSDPTSGKIYFIYAIMDNGLGDTKPIYMTYPSKYIDGKPISWTEDKSQIVGHETGGYKVNIESIFGYEITVTNIETGSIISNGYYDGIWHERKGYSPKDLMKHLEQILKYGIFNIEEPKDYKCTCEDSEEKCPFCLGSEIERINRRMIIENT